MEYLLKSTSSSNPGAQTLAEELSQRFELEKEVAQILVGRGIGSVDEARAFLHPRPEDLCEPFAFQDMKRAVSLIGNAIATEERILIHGDYDADGTTASALLYRVLQQMGGNVTVHLPSRSGNGYGLAMETIEQYKDYKLLITVDCGIANAAEIRRAKELGMRTIVTDHHTCPDELPEADCILNPKRPGETYPFAELCGAGIAFKLAQALCGDDALNLIDLAAVGTIADLVPLVGENRTIAFLGIDRFNADPNLGLGILFETLKGPGCHLDAEAVGFSLAPCINAAGRLSSAKLAFDLMTATNPAIARVLAQSLEQLNTRRQERQKEISQQVSKRLSAMTELPQIVVLHDDTWETGLVGLAAGRVTEETNRPAILLGKSGENYVGSARSVGAVNIYEALRSVEHLLMKFGGHSAAAGLTVAPENLVPMAEGLEEYMAHLQLPQEEPEAAYDLEIHLPINPRLAKGLSVLEPCGNGNPKPQILVRRATLTEVRPLSDGAHAAFVLQTKDGALDAVSFRTDPASLPKQADAVGSVDVSDYTGREQMIISLLSFRDPGEIPFIKAVKYVICAKNPKDAQRFFCDKSQLGRIYSAIRSVTTAAGPQSCAGLFAAVLRLLPGLTRHQYAFALAVFGDLKLLRGIRNARIEVTTTAQKRHLEDSSIFRVFEESANGSQGKN